MARRGRKPSLKTAAMLTKLKLEYGLMSAPRARDWARKKAVELGDPPYFLVEMARVKNPRPGRLIEILEGALGFSGELPVLRLLLGGLHEPLGRNPRLAGKFAAILVKVSEKHAGELPKDMRNMHVFAVRQERLAAGRPFPGDSPLRLAADLLEFLGRFRQRG